MSFLPNRSLRTFIAACALTLACAAQAQDGAPLRAELTVRVDQPQWQIDRHLYGQFAEHLGRGIYEGLWVGEDSPIPNTRGLRNDVVGALKKLKIPDLRWPGGCFADVYHWRDGIGPRAQRPKIVNNSWGGVTEDNAFGTHEFMDLVEQLGTEAYVSVNLGSGTPQEARDWMEYMTSDADSALTELRRRNGRDAPWKVNIVGVGNENWGCGGQMRPEYYADEYRRYQLFVRQSDRQALRIASGANSDDYNWTEVLMREAGRFMDGLAVHYYTVPFAKKGPSTGFGEAAWAETLKRATHVQELLERHGAIMDRYDPDKKVALVMDEWGTWYAAEPGTNPAFLYQQNTLRDAMVAALTLNVFQAHADRLKMANIAQMVNVLQAMILTDKERMVLTPTYHVFDMYKVHQDATYVPVELQSPEYRVGETSMPALSVTASRDAQGRLHLSIVNVDPHHPARVSARIAGFKGTQLSAQVLTAAALDSYNSFDRPQVVQPQPFNGAKLKNGVLSLELPAKSIVAVELR